MTSRRRSQAAGSLLFLIGLTAAVGASGIAWAHAATGVTVVASVDGQAVGGSSQNQPVKLFPRQGSILTVTVTNGGSTPIDVQEVRVGGQVIGLTFFSYDTAVNLPVAPGATATQHLAVDLSGLNGQATGLIPGSVQVLDAHHQVLASQHGVVDVRGSLRSVYGLFGLGVAFLTALSFLGALVGLARHRLPANRWRRALRFLTPGIGLGLVINFTLSATRVFVPELGRWLGITVVSALGFFGIGYLTPTPDLDQDEPAEEPTRVVEEITLVAIAARPGQPAFAAQPPVPQLEGQGTPSFDWRPPEELPAYAAPPAPEAPAVPTPSRVTAQVSSDPRATLPAGFTAVPPPPTADNPAEP